MKQRSSPKQTRLRPLHAVILTMILALSLLGLFGDRLQHQVRDSLFLEPLYEAPPADAQRALFVGNSHTSRHSISWMMQRIVASIPDARPLWIEEVVPDGARLLEHWGHGPTSRRAADPEAYDVLLLQPQSAEPLYDPPGFKRAVRAFGEAAGQRPVLLEVLWPKAPGHPLYQEVDWEGGDATGMLSRLEEESEAAIEGLPHARLVPVGRAWQLAVRQGQGLPVLYADDGAHTSLAGAYLTATTLVASLPGQPDVRQAKWRPEGLAEAHAEALRQLAWQAHQEASAERGQPKR